MAFKGDPVVVQGTAMASPYDHHAAASTAATATGGRGAPSDPAQHGEKQVGSYTFPRTAEIFTRIWMQLPLRCCC